MGEILIREMVIDDVYRGFCRLLNQLSQCSLTPAQAIEVFKERECDGVRTFVAISDDDVNKIIGTASLIIERKYIHGGDKSGRIEDVVVDHAMRKSGVGAKLIRRCIEDCTFCNCYKITLSCNSAVIPFYEKLGFILYDNGMRLYLV